MARRRPTDDIPGRRIRVRGRDRPYLERLRIRRRDYYLLEKLGSPTRQRYLAFDPLQGPGGAYFLIQRLPLGATTHQQLQVLRRLKDDSLPRIVEWQRGTRGWDLALTWVEGVSLDVYLSHIASGRRPPVSPEQAVRLIHGLANGICRMHHKLQVTHGDIQPRNLVLTAHPSRLLLIDFGSAWTRQASKFREHGDGHNRCYAAPELQDGSFVEGFHADQFSVSVLLYQLLTGVLPYDGLGGKAGRPEYRAKVSDALVAPSRACRQVAELPRSLHEGIDRVTLCGLALDADARYPNRHAWLDDLFEVSARMRLKPKESTGERVFTRVIEWFIRPEPTR